MCGFLFAVGAQNRRATSEPRTSEGTSNDLSPSNSNANKAADSVSNEDVCSCNEDAPGDDESNKPVVNRQGTFSKEEEREEESEDTVPLTRCVSHVNSGEGERGGVGKGKRESERGKERDKYM